MKTSDLENDIKRLLASTKSRDEFDGVQRQLSCRINVVRHYQIGVLADKLNMTRTGLAEHLLEQATGIAWSAAGFGELSDVDINAIKALTKAPEAPKEEGNLSASATLQPVPTPKQTDKSTLPPKQSDYFATIFRHLGLECGKVKGTVAVARDQTVRVCCLTSKNHEASDGEKYWFTIHERQLADIQQSKHAYVAFGCGSAHQIIMIPAEEFSKWCDDLPPTTQGETGWHVHLRKVSRLATSSPRAR